MRRAQYRRGAASQTRLGGRRRIIAAVATLVAFGGVVAVTQVSDASTRRATQRALNACNNITAPAPSESTDAGTANQDADDSAAADARTAELRRRCREWVLENGGGGSGQPSPSTSSASTKPDDPSTDPSGSSSAPDQPPAPSESQSSPAPPPSSSAPPLEILTNTCKDS